jgi:hypothetical protein
MAPPPLQQPHHSRHTQHQVLPPLQIDTTSTSNAGLPSAARLPIPSPTVLASSSNPRPLPPLAPLIHPNPPTNTPINGGTAAKSGPLHPATLPPPTQYAGTKRAHDQSFRYEPEQPRFQDGARETATAEDVAGSDTENMTFFRADGTRKGYLDLRF